jgi:hypothetical protein
LGAVGDASAAGAAILASAAGEAIGAASWAKAGIANAAAKAAAERIERVRFIYLDLLGISAALNGPRCRYLSVLL